MPLEICGNSSDVSCSLLLQGQNQLALCYPVSNGATSKYSAIAKSQVAFIALLCLELGNYSLGVFFLQPFFYIMMT